MSGLTAMAVLGAALLLGMVWGVKLENSAWRRAEKAAKQIDAIRRTPGRRRSSADASVSPGERTTENPRKKRLTTSKWIALGVLLIDGSSTYFVLYLCWLSITRQFTGNLPYLTALIGAMQAATGYVLGHYFKKSTAENTVGGITYDAALGTVSNSDTTSIFDTV